MLSRSTKWVILLSLAAAAMLVWHGWRWTERYLRTPMTMSVPQVVELRRGESLISLAQRLAADGILQHPRIFSWYARWQGQARTIQAGEYRIEPGTSPQQLLALLAEGRVVQYSVTLVEGWTVARALDEVARQAKLEHQLTGTNIAALLELLAPGEDYPGIEGLLYPDTYFYRRGSTDLELLQRAHRRLSDVLVREWAARDPNLPYESSYQAMVMASLVEKETGLAVERERIAGVFVRRLQRGMRLQTDPTVIYGLGTDFDGNLTRAQLKQPGPFNTYMNHGLPPTPICLVGTASIRAALHPAPGNDLYFVARGDGSHEFSATLEEHLEAVRRYQVEARTRNYRSTPASQAGRG